MNLVNPFSFKSVLFLFLFSFFNTAAAQNISLIVSTIGPQEIFEGARIEVNFSTFKYVDTCTFSSPNLPSFGQIINNGKGHGKFVFDPTDSDSGIFDITLDASEGNASSSQTFRLTVLQIPDGTAVFYCDPTNGNADNNGDKDHPFGTLKEVVNSNFNIPAGSIFFLRDGNHGRPVFSGANNKMVHVLAEAGHNPMIEQISMPFTNNWNIQGIKISPEAAGLLRKDTYVNIFSGSRDIIIQNCEIYAKKDISDWTTNQHWYDSAGDGIISSGQNCTFKNNYIYNTWFPVQIFPSGVNNLLSHNIIDYFGADAVRGLSNHSQFLYNQIKNAIVDDYATGNHDDAFQSWTNKSKIPPVVGLVIRGNQITDINDPNLPLPTSVMQGIIDFDGFVEDWIIEDNLVVQHHSHGIALYGAKNCRIANNTIVRNPLNIHSPNDHPWIRINRTKEPQYYLSTGNLTRNNIMGESIQDEYPGSFDHNLVSKDYADIFVDYANWDFHLKDKTNTVDAGFIEGASTIDLDLHIRNDENPDLGCYEHMSQTTDLQSPTSNNNISATNQNSTSVSLTWEESTDNVGIKAYLIKYNDDRPDLSVGSSELFLTDLSDEWEYQVQVYAVDLANNQSSLPPIQIISPEYNYSNDTLFCGADYHDCEVNSDDKLEWVRSPFLNIGGATSTIDQVGVIPFRLPAIPLGASIIGAELELNLEGIIGSPEGNLDLYGMGSRGNAEILPSFFWQGSFDHESAKGHALVENFISINATSGKIKTDSTQGQKLVKFIVNQYNKNSNPGDYIFLRLNASVLDEKANAYFQIASGNHPKSLKRPILKIFTSKPVATNQLAENEQISIYPNPILISESFKIKLPEYINEIVKIEILDVNGRVLYKNSYTKGDNISANVFKTKGIFFLNVQSKNMIWQNKIIVN